MFVLTKGIWGCVKDVVSFRSGDFVSIASTKGIFAKVVLKL